MRFVYNDGGRKAAGFRGTCDDCAVRAIVIATGLPYRQVYNDLQAAMDYYREHGRKSKLRSRLRTDKMFKRGSVRDGVYKEFCRTYIESLGWEWMPTMLIGSGCQVHLRDGELPMGRLIVAVSRHLVAVIDGVVHDLFDPSREGTRCVYGYWKEPPMSNHGYMDEQEAMNLIAEFSRNQIRMVHQANSGTGRITKNALAAEKKLSEQILSGLIGRKLDDSLKEKLAERLV